MFDKFSALDVDSAGAGGEYTVQAGFGWTNGVVLWVADMYGDVLVQPDCPDFMASAEAAGVVVSAASVGNAVGTGWYVMMMGAMLVGGWVL
jgi:alpha,alpha-trehalase